MLHIKHFKMCIFSLLSHNLFYNTNLGLDFTIKTKHSALNTIFVHLKANSCVLNSI